MTSSPLPSAAGLRVLVTISLLGLPSEDSTRISYGRVRPEDPKDWALGHSGHKNFLWESTSRGSKGLGTGPFRPTNKSSGSGSTIGAEVPWVSDRLATFADEEGRLT